MPRRSGRLETAVLNLILNARDAMPEGGTVTLSAANVTVTAGQIGELASGDYVELAVRDTGHGMPTSVLARAFEPFFSTKPVGQGVGLGLSMVYGFAKQSGGTARIETAPGAGTTVCLYLPRAESEATPLAAARPPPALGETASVRILLVEDEPDVRQMTADVLTELGHRVVIAGSGPEALGALQRDAAVDLLITDIVMPRGMSGVALAWQARQSHPDLRVLLITGYGFGRDGESFATRGFPLLRKPYRPSQLAATVREVLSRPPSQVTD